MSRKKIKNIFWFFIVFLPLQYAVVGIIGYVKSEPWPAFVLPAFKSVFDETAQTVVRRTTFTIQDERSGQMITIPASAFFKEINKSQLRGFLRSHFASAHQLDTLSPAAKIWMKSHITQYYPSWEGEQVQLKWIDQYYRYSATGVHLDTTITTKSFTISLKRG